jgi:hypothetical protein
VRSRVNGVHPVSSFWTLTRSAMHPTYALSRVRQRRAAVNPAGCRTCSPTRGW